MLPVRSAAPATRPGRNGSVALIAVSIALRVAIFSPAAATGSASIQPGMPVAPHAACHSGVATNASLREAQSEWVALPLAAA